HGRTQPKAGAVRVRGDRVATHGFRAHTEGQGTATQQDHVRSLSQTLDARPAHALHEVRRHFGRHTRVEADVAGQQESVVTHLCHRAGNDGVDLLSRQTGTGEGLACDLDTEIDGRNEAERPRVIDKRRAYAVDEPRIAPLREERAGRNGA